MNISQSLHFFEDFEGNLKFEIQFALVKYLWQDSLESCEKIVSVCYFRYESSGFKENAIYTRLLLVTQMIYCPTGHDLCIASSSLGAITYIIIYRVFLLK